MRPWIPCASALAALSSPLLGCSSDGDARAPESAPSARGAGGAAAPASSVSLDGDRIEAKIIARQIRPGDEQHVCVVLALPNTDAVWVSKVHSSLTAGSHHLIVDRQPTGSDLSAEPTPCAPTMAGDATRLTIAQQSETDVTLPEGVAFGMEPHQPLFLQLHYSNVGDVTRDISGTVELVLLPPGDEPPVEAHSLFTGSLSISLPAHSPGQATSFVVPQAPAGERYVFALTSHTHKLGVDATIERVGSELSPPTTPIHESTNWDEPPLTMFTPPLTFDGTAGLRLVCKYQNTTSQTVQFGTATTDEMCFMWVYYYDR